MSTFEDRYDVRVGFDGMSIVINIYCQRMPGYWTVAKPITLEFSEQLKEAERHEPTLKLNHLEGELLKKAFARAFNKDPDEKDIKIATQKALIEMLQDQIEDFREMLKFDKPRPRRRIEI